MLIGGTASTVRIANGTYEEYMVLTSLLTTRIIYLSGTGFTGSIDNVSVRQRISLY